MNSIALVKGQNGDNRDNSTYTQKVSGYRAVKSDKPDNWESGMDSKWLKRLMDHDTGNCPINAPIAPSLQLSFSERGLKGPKRGMQDVINQMGHIWAIGAMNRLNLYERVCNKTMGI